MQLPRGRPQNQQLLPFASLPVSGGRAHRQFIVLLYVRQNSLFRAGHLNSGSSSSCTIRLARFSTYCGGKHKFEVPDSIYAHQLCIDPSSRRLINEASSHPRGNPGMAADQAAFAIDQSYAIARSTGHLDRHGATTSASSSTLPSSSSPRPRACTRFGMNLPAPMVCRWKISVACSASSSVGF